VDVEILQMAHFQDVSLNYEHSNGLPPTVATSSQSVNQLVSQSNSRFGNLIPPKFTYIVTEVQ
jgi:hypothetical protein